MTDPREAEAAAARLDEAVALRLLRHVAAAGGAISPAANPTAKNGYEIDALGPEQAFLPRLADLGYLDRRFVDRVSLCPRCASHHLNLREVCPTCRSANLADEPLLHHFRCGYVGRLGEFETESGDQVCPKCNRPLRHLGVEFDRLGKTFRCRDCGLSFQDPPVDALCLACGAHGSAEDLPSVSVFGYAITSQGLTAIESGAAPLGDEATSLALPGGEVYAEPAMLAFLEQEARRGAFFGQESWVLVIVAPQTLEADDGALIERIAGLRRQLRDIDLVGRIGPRRFAALLPQTSRAEAERLLTGLVMDGEVGAPLVIALAPIAAPGDLSPILQPNGAE